MTKKSTGFSMEIMAGMALVVMGVIAFALHVNGMVAEALAPFGIGLILSDVLARAGKAARESVKIRVRRDDD